MKNEKTVFACDLSAFDKDQRARYQILTKQLFSAKREARELPDGYSIGFPANSQNINDAAEFIAYERLCCPFLNFELAVEGDDLTLRLKGAEGVKDFLKAELGL